MIESGKYLIEEPLFLNYLTLSAHLIVQYFFSNIDGYSLKRTRSSKLAYLT